MCDPDFIRKILIKLLHFFKKICLGVEGTWGVEEKEVNSTRDGGIRKDFTEES